MKLTRLSTPLTLASVGAVLLIGYLALTSPGHLVVSERGDISGIANIARATLQGSSFWREQAQEAKAELKEYQAASKRLAERNARIATAILLTEQQQNKFYKLHPRAKPSPAEQKAESVREEADKIEQAELDLIIEQHRIARTEELEKLIRVLETRSRVNNRLGGSHKTEPDTP